VLPSLSAVCSHRGRLATRDHRPARLTGPPPSLPCRLADTASWCRTRPQEHVGAPHRDRAELRAGEGLLTRRGHVSGADADMDARRPPRSQHSRRRAITPAAPPHGRRSAARLPGREQRLGRDRRAVPPARASTGHALLVSQQCMISPLVLDREQSVRHGSRAVPELSIWTPALPSPSKPVVTDLSPVVLDHARADRRADSRRRSRSDW
jgi:hypothetical protein